MGHPADELRRRHAGTARLADAAEGCRECELYRNATQVVFGEGKGAAVVLVGEQPGDREDREGRPFVGPAGRLLDQALEAAAIDRGEVYVTNAVKHFKWRPGQGARRLHAKPKASEIAACRPWLEAEIAAVEPALIVGLGATACQSLLGPEVRVTRHRGEIWDLDGIPVLITIHPSAILRGPDEDRRREMDRFVADLRLAVPYL